VTLAQPSVTCIIPLGPNEPVPETLIKQLKDPPCPLILSATASTAETSSQSRQFDWLVGPTGRAKQLNRAIEVAQSEWVWLLHADSQLSPNTTDSIMSFCSKANWREIGYGRLHFANDGPSMVRLNQYGANLRSTLFGQPYGDQGLCIHKRLWSALGGFSEHLSRGEDLDFVIRARSLEATPKQLNFTITTSARRYGKKGWLQTTIDHQIKAWQLIRSAKRWRP